MLVLRHVPFTISIITLFNVAFKINEIQCQLPVTDLVIQKKVVPFGHHSPPLFLCDPYLFIEAPLPNPPAATFNSPILAPRSFPLKVLPLRRDRFCPGVPFICLENSTPV